MIRLNLETYTLSSSLPDSFVIDNMAGDYVDVHICVESDSVYSTRLYANAGSCTFYELRQIVEQNMTARGLSLASLVVVVDYGNGTESVTGKYIIFSRYRNAERSDILFLESHFLVNRSYYVIPRNRNGSVSFFATAGENISPYVDCVFDNGESLRNYRLGLSFSHLNRPNVYSFSLSPSSIKAQVDNIEGGDYGKLLSFTLHVGLRSITVYVVDDVPCAEFSFCNSFNAQEKLFVFGTTTLKTEISQKEAVSMDITSFYDKSVSRKWQVKTSPLTLEEARWYNEFLESDHVTIVLNQEYNQVPVLISDITSEISDSSKDQVHIKFSWRFEDNGSYLIQN